MTYLIRKIDAYKYIRQENKRISPADMCKCY